VDEVFRRGVELVKKSAADDNLVVDRLEDEFARHSTEIFAKGYDFKIKQSVSHEQAVSSRSMVWQRFSSTYRCSFTRRPWANNTRLEDLRAARRICSGLLVGILQGYGYAVFGVEHGWQELPRFRRAWAHSLAFLLPRHLDQVAAQIAPGELRTGLQDTALPVLKAIDHLIENCVGGCVQCRAWASSYAMRSGSRSRSSCRNRSTASAMWISTAICRG